MSRNMNGFSVEIPECIEQDCDGYVTMKHEQKFTIKINNHHKSDGYGKPCDTDVYVDGKHVGSFRLAYGETIRLEHPINDNGCFTAYKKGTQEACQANINPYSDEAGLIKVVFRPGHYPSKFVRPLVVNWHPPADGDYVSNCCASYNSCKSVVPSKLVSGGVGLSGHSDQKFNKVENLVYIESPTTIYMRIVFKEYDDQPRPLRPVYNTSVPRPLR